LQESPAHAGLSRLRGGVSKIGSIMWSVLASRSQHAAHEHLALAATAGPTALLVVGAATPVTTT
jgi:hypothetical protein